MVECNFCHKKGHREYECYTKKRGKESISREVRLDRKTIIIFEDKIINSSGEVVIVTMIRDFNVS